MGSLGWLTQALMLEEGKITSREGRDSSANVTNIRGKSLRLLNTECSFYLSNIACHFPPPFHRQLGQSIEAHYD
jgi:hypothetical protein